VIDHLMVACHGCIARLAGLKASQVMEGDLLSVEFGSPRAAVTWSMVEVPQVSIAVALAHPMPRQGAEAIDACLLAARAIDDQVRKRLELRRRDDPGDRGDRGVDTGLLRRAGRRGRGLVNAESQPFQHELFACAKLSSRLRDHLDLAWR
jgi:hypothetical protein